MTNAKLRLSSLLLLVGVSGCLPSDGSIGIPPPPPLELVAHVSNIKGGTLAYVEHAGVKGPATEGQPIYTGDHFYTGPGTLMDVTLEQGGTFTLDQNVDPTFFKTVKCVVLNFLTGRLAVDASGACVESQGSRLFQNSYVLYEAFPGSGGLSVTVVRGRVETLRPPGIVVNEGENIVLQRGQVVSPPRKLTPGEISRALSWVPVTIL